jgi:hypothetical protein
MRGQQLVRFVRRHFDALRQEDGLQFGWSYDE